MALSSGEAEFYGAVTLTAEAIALRSLGRDWNLQYGITLHLDAEACIGAVSRRGLGKAQHIDTAFMWVQEKIESLRIAIKKEPTQDMIADMLTKFLSGAGVTRHLASMGYSCREGQHPLALKE